jgi:hypothetical protein
VPESRDIAAELLPLWTALPLQVDFDLICLARCKHLSGVPRSDQGAQMGNLLAPASIGIRQTRINPNLAAC